MTLNDESLINNLRSVEVFNTQQWNLWTRCNVTWEKFLEEERASPRGCPGGVALIMPTMTEDSPIWHEWTTLSRSGAGCFHHSCTTTLVGALSWPGSVARATEVEVGIPPESRSQELPATLTRPGTRYKDKEAEQASLAWCWDQVTSYLYMRWDRLGIHACALSWIGFSSLILSRG